MAETTTLTLAEFLLARIEEDQDLARDDLGDDVDLGLFRTDELITRGGHRLAVTRRRVLAECEAKRRIVEHATGLIADALIMDRTPYEGALLMMTLALPYADHPDYRKEWRP